MESPWNAVPSENITLLQRGFLQELQGDLCPTMDLPGLQGHGCLTVFCTMACRGVSAPAPGTPAAPPFSLLWSLQSWFSLIFHCSSRGSEAFFPFWKLLSRRWHSLGCCAQLCLAGLLALAGTDFIQLYPVQWPPFHPLHQQHPPWHPAWPYRHQTTECPWTATVWAGTTAGIRGWLQPDLGIRSRPRPQHILLPVLNPWAELPWVTGRVFTALAEGRSQLAAFETKHTAHFSSPKCFRECRHH